MKYVIATTCAVFVLAGTTDAKAYLVAKPLCKSLACRMHSQLTNLKHARYVCQQGRHYAKKWSCTAVKWLKREYHQTMAALHPRVTVSSHYAGWECIHGGEGNGDDPTGTYHGPLQMTWGWAGHNVNWDSAPMSEVFAIADAEAAAHGYSYSWMQGQWPNTFPPCAGYFN